MPEVHLPHVEDEEEEPTAARADAPAPASPPQRSKRWRSMARVALEVVLISGGVFLGLMGEQWREGAKHRELAEGALRRFRTEIAANRTALLAVKDYHATLGRDLSAYLDSREPKSRQTFHVQFHGVGPVWFQHSARDLALATQSLAYMEPALAFAISRAYTIQDDYADLQRAILQSTLYGRSRTADFEGYVQSVADYLGDIRMFDPMLLRAYDEVLPQIDRALREPGGSR